MALVSIGIPTYNRAQTLRRTLESATAQTHHELEIVISDNGSTDGTQELCEAWMERDERVRYLRQPVNRGPMANFNTVIDALRGPYVLLLADDDWLDDDYVERCLAELDARPDYAIVAGRARHLRDGEQVGAGLDTQLTDDNPVRRVRRYLAGVDDNGIFYGLMRREALQHAAPMRDVLGADWLVAAGVVYAGKVMVLPEPRLNRAMGGTSETIAKIFPTLLGLSPAQRRLTFAYTAANAFADMAWRSPAYAPAGRLGRIGLALRVAPSAMRWKGMAFELLAPTLAGLRRRPRGRLLRLALIRAVGLVARLTGRPMPPLG